MRKIVLSIILTLFGLIGFNSGLSWHYHTSFIEFSFFSGLIVTFFLLFFNSTGEGKIRYIDSGYQGVHGVKSGYSNAGLGYQFSFNGPFWTSLAYTLVFVLL